MLNNQPKKLKKFLVVDCSSVIYRIYFITSKNTEKVMRLNDNLWTNVIYGFIRFLIHIIKKERFDYICCAFDYSRKTFRTDYFPNYKVQRPKTPEHIIYQIKIIQDFLKLAGVPFLSIENYEADDIIGTIVEKFKSDANIYIYSSDHDLLQLVNNQNNIIFCNIQKGMVKPLNITKENFNQEVKIPMKYFLDYKILNGDQSDNLRGIPSWGIKTILNYLIKFNGLENLLNNIDKIPSPKHRNSLKDHLDQIELYKKIIPIYKRLDINPNINAYSINRYYKNIRSDKVIDFYKKYKLRTFYA
ncbi:5'-3' exonuclease [Mycoplasma sp. SG1]|uniref:5'-3' exonuclease n=1 Tax=Mycoplasma sp. SG1 TaxID=2810348 RepID=UPI0020243144|nr:5'-3' exonuclease H3TH domain-containing protein [Mycoplasma sp. SG1]URM52798.1 hypothetical protein JRW51_00425 [Mycoplasma sp. SG1]